MPTWHDVALRMVDWAGAVSPEKSLAEALVTGAIRATERILGTLRARWVRVTTPEVRAKRARDAQGTAAIFVKCMKLKEGDDCFAKQLNF